MNKALVIKIKHLMIDKQASLLQALKQMDAIDKKLLLVFENMKFVNILSVGDIQRAILKSLALEEPIAKILRTQTQISNVKDSVEEIKKRMADFRIECMPVIDNQNNLVDVYIWEDIFSNEEKITPTQINLPVVIMAGGEGTRLKPLTNVIPKPLIPIGEKTIIENIMDRFVDVGCSSFYLSINYKADSIKQYFIQLDNSKYLIQYFQEPYPLGTVGSLFLLKGKLKTTFFISNCDIIITDDYSEILNYHKESKNELTIVAALKHYPIPYGIVETGENGGLMKLMEKPELTFQINSGMYILEPHLLEDIPENTFFHITDLIEKIRGRKGKVGVFPVSEGSWTDIGDWGGYLEIIKKS